ncbi:MAG: NADP-dependent malic enzyme [Bacteroidota bacterium]|nr:NADP-dependent malic enzyme [Bacteroidota bacterium]
MDNLFRKDAFEYHSKGRPGKIEVVPTKPYSTQRDLSLAYTPGVADPCLAIEKDPEKVYDYTAKGNLVAVISNGTAVLGLGDIGTEAGKPVMEGKGLLFKVFSDIDVFDIEIDNKNTSEIVDTIVNIAPTFGGINLEDFKAPECFEIEQQVKERLNIPVMHDDQHGTAIITTAGMLNAIEIVGKKPEELKIVVNGAGAASISCTKLYIASGVKPENIVMLDSKGVIYKGRTDLNKYKAEFAVETEFRTLEEAVVGADMFLGLSVAGVLSPKMLKTMAKNPIVFALANPNPEISYEDAINSRNDVIMATGRSDFPNQVNNVLGFPFIFRGALDVRATEINEEMKLAASKALSELTKEPVPDEVNQAYHSGNLRFGKDYIIPKPTDPRLILYVAPAVAKAAMDSGVAQKPIADWKKYEIELSKRLGIGNPLLRRIKGRAKSDPKRVVFSEACSYKMLKAAEIVINEGIAEPILLGKEKVISQLIRKYELEIPGNIQVIDPASKEERQRIEQFSEILYKDRFRKGLTLEAATELMQNKNYFSTMLVKTGYADTMISGLTNNYPDTIRPALYTIGKKAGHNRVSAMYIINTKRGPYFFADCAINADPDADTLYDIAVQTAETVREFNIEPHIAMLSYSNFGSNKGEKPRVIKEIVARFHKERPDLIIDGEVQANVALNQELLKENFPFSKLIDQPANVLIFPNLNSANIAYKLMQELTTHEVIGPVLMGLDKPVHILPIGSKVNDIVNMIAIAVNNAQNNGKKNN